MPDDRPDLTDVLETWFGEFSRELHTSFPGKVERYDATKQVVDVQPMVRRALEDENGDPVYEDYPVLPSIKLLFPRMGKWFVTFPVVVGDWVQVLCSEGSIGHLLATGEKMDAGDLRRHHLSHAVALIGFAPFTQSLAGVSTTDMVLGHEDGAVIAIKPSGEVHLASNPAGDYLALAAKVDKNFSDLKSIFQDGWVVLAQDGGAALKTALRGWLPETVKASKVKGT